MTDQPQFRPQGDTLRAPRAVRIVAPGRLHIGFLDLNGSLGRRFGSLGLTLERPATRVFMQTAAEPSAVGPDSDRARQALSRIARTHGVDERVRIVVEEALPAHSGLGSGTQMALAIGVGASLLNGRGIDSPQVAASLSRGARSSIGLGAFQGGGVLLDGGQPAGERPSQPPPLLSRIAIPAAWRILLIFDATRAGLSGATESEAMEGLPEFPEALADRLCRLVLMAALPAAASGDARRFGLAVGEIQRRLGDHFSRFQGGRFTSPDVAEALQLIEAAGVPGVGQSSWGPTGFAIFGEAQAAELMASDLRARFADRPNLTFDVVSGNNHGATIEDARYGDDGASG